ncbi:hypothetical protein GCM10027174_19520 [Salinifilum aidingensis]
MFIGETPLARRPGSAGDASQPEGEAMGKRARKKKDRRKNNANHGKRPNAGRG